MNVQSCPLDQNCNDNSVRQTSRRVAGFKRAYWNAVMRKRAAVAKKALEEAEAWLSYTKRQ